MKRVYRLTLATSIMFVLLGLLARFIAPYIPERDSYLLPIVIIDGLKDAGFVFGGLFLIFSILNWVGCRWDIRGKRFEEMPVILLMAGAGVSMMTIVLLMNVGGDGLTTLVKAIICGGSLAILLWMAAFLIRGMAHERTRAEVMAEYNEWRRQRGYAEISWTQEGADLGDQDAPLLPPG